MTDDVWGMATGVAAIRNWTPYDREVYNEIEMQLTGDPSGLEQLKQMTKKNREFFKFLISEARTNSSASAPFKGEDGKQYILKINTVTDTISVQPG